MESKEKPHPQKYGEIMSECNKDGTHVLAPFPNRDFHFLCSASGVHTENIIICLYDKVSIIPPPLKFEG
jgi:hypothetical protein